MGLLPIGQEDLESADDKELAAAFHEIALEMGRRGRAAWEHFFESLASDDSADAEEVRWQLNGYILDED